MQGRDDLLCFSRRGAVTWGAFAADVTALRPRIAGASHVCNVLADRYDFMVGLAAAMLNGQTTILPNAAAVEAVSAAIGVEGVPLILGGEAQHDAIAARLPSLDSGGGNIDPAETLAALRTSTAEIHVFTSGTTKQPRRHLKSWAILAGGAEITDVVLRKVGLAPGEGGLLGTTPHQHMYGLEATVFASLGYGYCAHRGNLFFPADLDAAVEDGLASGIEAFVLVTSPAHLKFLEATILKTPQIRGVLSATAPLSQAQAERLEARGDLPVMEIYGSTETGSLAIRRTVEGNLWQPLAGFTLTEVDEGWQASAPYLPAPVLMGDGIEFAGDGRFRLLGRVGDMVSMNGKRTSLAALNAVLIEAPGLIDGVVLHQKREGEDLLAIIAVRDPAAGLSEREACSAIRQHFHRHLDPVFAARRIVFAERLPRSGTGKITAAAMRDLFALAGIETPDTA
ncbi:acyl-CoA synthetase [Rhodobacteraceae bacterium NNCM2]|nr:acyl-CoA synthetase [Coraliihabitans acroporae]